MIKNIKSNFKTINKQLSQSVYFKWFNNHRTLIIFCTFLALFLTFLTYPGIMYSDSYERVRVTTDLKVNLKQLVLGQDVSHSIPSWLTITPSFFILFFKTISGNIAFYTFFQCFFFLLAVYVFSDLVAPKRYRTLNKIILTFIPVTLGFGVFYEPGVGSVTAILIILTVVWKWQLFKTKLDKIITVLVLTFVSFICFGYRANAITIFPVLLMTVLIIEKDILKRLILMSSIVFGLLLTVIIPKLLRIDTMSSYAASFIWETVSVIQQLPSDKQIKYQTYLDDIFGKGITQRAVKNNVLFEQSSSVNPILWGKPFTTTDISNKNNGRRVLVKYFNIIKQEPATYFKVKKEFVFRTLGINRLIDVKGYIYNQSNRMKLLNFSDSPQRKIFIDFVQAFMMASWITRAPWLVFIMALGLILIRRFVLHKEPKVSLNIYELSFMVAVFYYGAFLLNTQAFEFRYFFPSWLILVLIIIPILIEIAVNRKTIALELAKIFSR